MYIRVILLWLSFLLLSFPLIYAKTIRVVDDRGTGIESEIYKIDRNGSELRIGSTTNGVFDYGESCETGQQVKIKPKSELYYGRKIECPLNTEKVLLTTIYYGKNLQSNAEYFEKTGEYGKATKVYNEMYARGLSTDKEASQDQEKKIYELFGKFLNNDNPTTYDPNQNKTVISPRFKEDIKNFQREQNIPVTGMIDLNTLNKSDKTPISDYVFKNQNKGFVIK